jgi:hypothetical protein
VGGILILVAAILVTASPTKAEPDHPAEALRAARTFLRAVADGDDKAAYELTSPTYRKENSREQFAGQTRTLRERAGLSKELAALPPMSGWVLVNPEPGRPKRGAFTIDSSRHMSADVLEKLARTTIGIRVEQQGDGRWLVTEARAIDRNREEMRFTQSLVDAARHGNDLRHVSSTIRGKLIRLKRGVMTIQVDPSPTAPTQRPPDRTLKLDEKAEVISITTTLTEPRKGAPLMLHESATAGAAVDVKEGVRVTVEPSEDGERAARIEVDASTSEGL